MPTGKSILRFVVTACCVYALLLGLWPVLGGVYASSFRSIGSIAFHTCGSNGVVRFESVRPPLEDDFDSILRVRNTKSGAGLSQAVSSRLLGYVPTIITMSLFVATVAADRRRWKPLFVALAAIHLFIALRIALLLLALFSGKNAVAQFNFGSVTGGLIDFLNDLCTRSPTLNYVLPLVLWMVLILGRSDQFTRIQRRKSPTPGQHPARPSRATTTSSKHAA